MLKPPTKANSFYFHFCFFESVSIYCRDLFIWIGNSEIQQLRQSTVKTILIQIYSGTRNQENYIKKQDMALDLHYQEQIAETVFDERCSTPLEKWKTVDDEPEDNLSGGFDCNICLDVVRDPVVTFCGHLYCWPCIYKWIQFQTISSENSDHQKPQCPVCKAEISQNMLIPLYGPGQATKPSEDDVPSKGVVIPQRPLRPICGSHVMMETTNSLPLQQLHHQHQPHSGGYMASPPMLSLGGTTTNVLHPMLGEVVYARMFGNAYPNSYNLAGNTSLRMRRQLLHADRSLSRLFSFLVCCVLACLLLF